MFKIEFFQDCYTLALPQLEILRGNVFEEDISGCAWKISLGAIALAIQPHLRIVECLNAWSTIQAIKYLIENDKKKKVSVFIIT